MPTGLFGLALCLGAVFRFLLKLGAGVHFHGLAVGVLRWPAIARVPTFRACPAQDPGIMYA